MAPRPHNSVTEWKGLSQSDKCLLATNSGDEDGSIILNRDECVMRTRRAVDLHAYFLIEDGLLEDNRVDNRHTLFSSSSVFPHKSICRSQLGKSKIFLRAGQIAVLDAQRNEVLENAAKIIQNRFRTFVSHREFVVTRVAAIAVQAYCRGTLHKFFFYKMHSFKKLADNCTGSVLERLSVDYRDAANNFARRTNSGRAQSRRGQERANPGEDEDVDIIKTAMGDCLVGRFLGRFARWLAIKAMAKRWNIKYDINAHKTIWLIVKFQTATELCVGDLMLHSVVLSLVQRSNDFAKQSGSPLGKEPAHHQKPNTLVEKNSIVQRDDDSMCPKIIENAKVLTAVENPMNTHHPVPTVPKLVSQVNEQPTVEIGVGVASHHVVQKGKEALMWIMIHLCKGIMRNGRKAKAVATVVEVEDGVIEALVYWVPSYFDLMAEGQRVAIYGAGDAYAANESGALREAKSKLEKKLEDLMWRLALEKKLRIASEESKLAEVSKLHETLKLREADLETIRSAFNIESNKNLLLQNKLDHTLKELESFKSDLNVIVELKKENLYLKGSFDSLQERNLELEGELQRAKKYNGNTLEKLHEMEAKCLQLQGNLSKFEEKLISLEDENHILRQKSFSFSPMHNHSGVVNFKSYSEKYSSALALPRTEDTVETPPSKIIPPLTLSASRRARKIVERHEWIGDEVGVGEEARWRICWSDGGCYWCSSRQGFCQSLSCVSGYVVEQVVS
ncbi:hypothetical protein ZIOFF_026481 [Zingiber officinale]|uniref:Uncharacterized protein n=1 Tax=Zingiber officinale TaxID=94328 RepID=A0A8J5LFS5_ZINOF|nr:hypothetical protein ZIOFF_026481 [Zingiber officinale]